MAIIGLKPWINPLEKISIFRVFELLVFIAQTGVVSFQNIVKQIFPGQIAKKIVGKMAIFLPKPWVNPFGKISIFRLFEHLVFMAQKIVFLFQNIVKHLFLAYTAKKKKKLEKLQFFELNHGLTPLEKAEFYDCFNFFFYSVERRFYFLEYRKTYFSGLCCQKKKKLEKLQFFGQNHGLTPLGKAEFFDFFNFLFLQPRKAFFRSRISKNTFSRPILPKKKSWKNGHFWNKTMF